MDVENVISKCPICGRDTEISREKQAKLKMRTDIHGFFCIKCRTFYAEPTFPNPNPYYLFTGTEKEHSYDTDELRSYLFYHDDGAIPVLVESDVYKNLGPFSNEKVYNLTPQMVTAWYPKTFAQKVDLILMKLYEFSAYDGAPIFIEDDVLFFRHKQSSSSSQSIDVQNQRNYMLSFLTDNGYIQASSVPPLYCLSPKALERIYELEKMQSVNKDVFVSMAFNEDTKDTREAIRSGINNAGFSSKFIDEIIHNHQIMPEMFRLIRECRFLILEISDPNYGAYYEAGYALGLGKEVIICCSKEVFDKKYETEEEKKYAKYLKPHFDIAQKQILVWNNYEDLTKKLSEWIKALF